MIPFGRNENFVGRDAILNQLLEKIPPGAKKDDCQRTAIEGLGGIGKTHIALEAAYRVRDEYPECSIFWVPAIDSTSFEIAYREIGQLLQLPSINDDGADVKTLVKRGLSQKSAGSWLLIIDNADDSELLAAIVVDCLPFSPGGSILFTTRNHRITSELDIPPQSILPVLEMDNAEATELLRKELKDDQISDREDINRLLSLLTNLPLAIKQASAYLVSNRLVTIAKYSEFCGSSNTVLTDMLSRHFEDRRRYKTHSKNRNPITTTWLVSFEYISRSNPHAANCLKFISLLAEKDIPLSLLPFASSFNMIEAVSTLHTYAFITKRDASNSINIYRLVRLATRNWLQEKGEWQQWTSDAVYQLAVKYPLPERENRETWIKYLPHGQAVLDIDDAVTGQRDTAFFDKIARSYVLLGKYNEAERLYRQAIRLDEEVLSREYPSTFTRLDSLAFVLYCQWKCEEAEEILRHILTERVPDGEHFDQLNSVHKLPLVLIRQKKYEEAENLLRAIVRGAEEILGKKHSSTLNSMDSLALVLIHQENYEEAEKILRHTFKVREKVLGREHPDILESMNSLSLVLIFQEKYEEAEKILRHIFKVREKVLGREHPDTLTSMNNLAVVLNTGKYEEAEKIHRQTLGLREEVLGREHPDTLNSMKNLALILKGRGSRKKLGRCTGRCWG
ncbi:P-loop containing nucleoside triphosphate hydrolase protein [Xylariaceae sp. FL0255]|nr:P-loop containing nucleoside triphosphate hydrolase protein [Xylariaceae sp. FL0255]